MTVNTLMAPRKEKLDHELIDGAPAARFTQRLKDLIERGFGLLDQEVTCAAVLHESSTSSVEQAASR